MKKIVLVLSFAFFAMTMSAVPARPGQWKTVKLNDGREVRVELCGDEHARFWRDADGNVSQHDGQRGAEGLRYVFAREHGGLIIAVCGPVPDNIAKTGDATPLAVVAIIAILAAFGLVVARRRREK